MSPAEHVKKHLKEMKMMQIASAEGDQPWVCTVFFVTDESANLYWLSTSARRHSKEIANNPKVAVAIAVKFDWPVVGIQSEGRAEVVKDPEIVKKIMTEYVNKYDQGHDFYDNFVDGTNQHELYKFTPKSYALFDETNFPGGEAKEWQMNND